MPTKLPPLPTLRQCSPHSRSGRLPALFWDQKLHQLRRARRQVRSAAAAGHLASALGAICNTGARSLSSRGRRPSRTVGQRRPGEGAGVHLGLCWPLPLHSRVQSPARQRPAQPPAAVRRPGRRHCPARALRRGRGPAARSASRNPAAQLRLIRRLLAAARLLLPRVPLHLHLDEPARRARHGTAGVRGGGSRGRRSQSARACCARSAGAGGLAQAQGRGRTRPCRRRRP